MKGSSTENWMTILWVWKEIVLWEMEIWWIPYDSPGCKLMVEIGLSLGIGSDDASMF